MSPWMFALFFGSASGASDCSSISTSFTSSRTSLLRVLEKVSSFSMRSIMAFLFSAGALVVVEDLSEDTSFFGVRFTEATEDLREAATGELLPIRLVSDAPTEASGGVFLLRDTTGWDTATAPSPEGLAPGAGTPSGCFTTVGPEMEKDEASVFVLLLWGLLERRLLFFDSSLRWETDGTSLTSRLARATTARGTLSFFTSRERTRKPPSPPENNTVSVSSM
mmetsp:Transcript_4126/g.14563  ORF Transcript_4126/g.14563 Transcript_4126/m.14563 type:complete len:222 (-) Transcript_4126:1544-2209(-)